MIFNRKLLQFMHFVRAKSKAQVAMQTDYASDTSQKIEKEIQEVVDELSNHHPDTEEYRKGSESLNILCEAVEKHDKQLVERQKVMLQLIEAKKRRAIDRSQLVSRVIAIVAYGVITCVLLGLERQTPLSMRWLKALDVLLAPKGI